MPQFSLHVIPVKQKGFTLYLAVVEANKLIELCAALRLSTANENDSGVKQFDSKEEAAKLVEALSKTDFAKEVMASQEQTYDKDEPYQRILDEARARSIASYLREENAMLPNGVILATRDDVEVAVSEANGLTTLTLEWDSETEEFPLNIIDGQHRIEGIKILVRDCPDDFAHFNVPVTLLVDQPFYVQAELFAVVNGRQKRVSSSRIYDLLGYLPMEDSEMRKKAYQGEMAVHRFCHHAVKVLNEAQKSPWKGRIKMRGTGPGIITQAALVDHLALYVKPKKDRPTSQVFPVLYPFYRNSDLVGLSKLLIIYFVGIQRAWEDFWKDDAALKACLFGKTNGVAVMFSVLHNLILMAGGAQNLQLDSVKSAWQKVDKAIIENPPKGGSKGYQAEVVAKVMQQMFGNDFAAQLPKKVEAIRESLKAAGGLVS
jgi:DGQHR domain-containing protein